MSYFDWALNEQCFQYQECGLLTPFRNAGKAVMNIEYKLGVEEVLPDGERAELQLAEEGDGAQGAPQGLPLTGFPSSGQMRT